MADQRDRNRGDEREQDGLGRDAAHGGGPDSTTGGSYGRSTGRAGEGDLLETGEGGHGGQAGSGGASIPRGTDEHASGSPGSSGGRGGQRASGDGDDVDLDVNPHVGRRDPTR